MSEPSPALREALAAAIEPIEKQLETIEQEIAELETRLNERRKDRTAARNVLRQLDPEKYGKPGPKAKKTTSGKGDNIAPEKVDELLDWLREHKNGDEFTTSSLAADDPIGRGPASIHAALTVLQRRGLIRLDRHDRNAKVYRLTRAGTAGK